jgi:hypothetical protein
MHRFSEKSENRHYLITFCMTRSAMKKLLAHGFLDMGRFNDVAARYRLDAMRVRGHKANPSGQMGLSPVECVFIWATRPIGAKPNGLVTFSGFSMIIPWFM